jgi:hypothetical protein
MAANGCRHANRLEQRGSARDAATQKRQPPQEFPAVNLTLAVIFCEFFDDVPEQILFFCHHADPLLIGLQLGRLYRCGLSPV